jgi:hypothetical protein
MGPIACTNMLTYYDSVLLDSYEDDSVTAVYSNDDSSLWESQRAHLQQNAVSQRCSRW